MSTVCVPRCLVLEGLIHRCHVHHLRSALRHLVVPVRSVLYTGTANAGDKVEKRYLDHQKSAAGKWFPSIIETWKNDILVKEQVVVEAKKNQKLPESMFRAP